MVPPDKDLGEMLEFLLLGLDTARDVEIHLGSWIAKSSSLCSSRHPLLADYENQGSRSRLKWLRALLLGGVGGRQSGDESDRSELRASSSGLLRAILTTLLVTSC